MSSTYSFASTDYAADYAAARQAKYAEVEKEKSKARLHKFIKTAAIGVGVVLGAELLWLFGITPFMPLSAVSIEGNFSLSDADILATAGITGYTSFVNLDAAKAEKALAGLYTVESVAVDKVYPGTVHITLQERVPAAVSVETVEGRQRLVTYDRHGYVIRIGSDTGATGGLPVVSGLGTVLPALGAQTDPALDRFFERLHFLSVNEPEIMQAFSGFEAVKNGYGGYSVVLYPQEHKTRVWVKSSMDTVTLSCVIFALEFLRDSGQEASMMDFRGSIPTYKLKSQV
jgi:cell division protein FtsQ